MNNTTPNGIRPGDLVSYDAGFGPETSTVTKVLDGGLRVATVATPWGVGWHACTKVEPVLTPTQDSAMFPFVGKRVSWTAPDERTVITVTRQHFTYAVEVYQGTLRLDDLCAAEPTEAAARAIARLHAELYTIEHTAAVAA